MEELGLLLVLLCSITAVLSLATLHRMRRILRQLERIAGNEERMLVHLADQTPSEVPEQPKEQYKPEELIDAVLEEVFS